MQHKKNAGQNPTSGCVELESRKTYCFGMLSGSILDELIDGKVFGTLTTEKSSSQKANF